MNVIAVGLWWPEQIVMTRIFPRFSVRNVLLCMIDRLDKKSLAKLLQNKNWNFLLYFTEAEDRKLPFISGKGLWWCHKWSIAIGYYIYLHFIIEHYHTLVRIRPNFPHCLRCINYMMMNKLHPEFLSEVCLDTYTCLMSRRHHKENMIKMWL